jgi:hypothetical protein
MALSTMPIISLAVLGIAVGFVSAPAQAETRGYLVSEFIVANNSADFKAQCPEDRNGAQTKWLIRDLIATGFTRDEAIKVIESANDTIQLGPEMMRKLEGRAIVNGKHVSIYNYPDALPDPNIETVTGKYAYGFDLDQPNKASKFEDPETHQPVDNQLWRAIGCLDTWRAHPPEPSYIDTYARSPGWALQISGKDLSRDGKVTITLTPILQQAERDVNGKYLSGASYTIDRTRESHNVLEGEIKDGLLTISPKFVRIEGTEFGWIAMRDTHMRIRSEGQKLVGYWGGFIKWQTFTEPYTSDPTYQVDNIGMYWAVKKMADAAPDPKTGQHMEISSAFYMEAIPAFILDEDGTVLAQPAPLHSRLGLPAAKPANTSAGPLTPLK